MRCKIVGSKEELEFLGWSTCDGDVVAMLRYECGEYITEIASAVTLIPDEPVTHWQTGTPPKDGWYLVTKLNDARIPIGTKSCWAGFPIG